jgi:hypothetical protein
MNIEVVDKALEIAAIGIVGVFIFMAFFYLVILALNKLFPYKEPAPEADSYAEDYEEDQGSD